MCPVLFSLAHLHRWRTNHKSTPRISHNAPDQVCSFGSLAGNKLRCLLDLPIRVLSAEPPSLSSMWWHMWSTCTGGTLCHCGEFGIQYRVSLTLPVASSENALVAARAIGSALLLSGWLWLRYRAEKTRLLNRKSHEHDNRSDEIDSSLANKNARHDARLTKHFAKT